MHTQLVTWKHIAQGSVYDSLRHFLDGESVYLPPRNLSELREVLYVFSLSLPLLHLTQPPTSRERGAMSYMFTYISQLRGGLRGSEFSTVRVLSPILVPYLTLFADEATRLWVVTRHR